MRKSLLMIIFLIANLIVLPAANAATKTYTGVGEYIMGERDTLETAKQGAKEKAMRNALEQAGVLVQSQTRVQDTMLVEDVITAQTGAVLQVLEVVYERKDLLVRATVKVDIDPEDLNYRLKNFENKQKVGGTDNISRSNIKAEQASELLRRGTLDGVLPILTEALQLDVGNASAYEKLGWFYREMKDYDNALLNHKKSLELNPDWYWNYAGLGRTYFEMQDYNAAIQNFSIFIRNNGNEEKVYQLRGEAYKALGKDDKARADFATAKHIAAANEKIKEAQRFCEQGNYDAASPIASEALALNQNNALIWETVGRIYNGKREYDKSIFYYEKAIQLDSKLADAYNGLGRACLELKKYKEAATNFSKYIELNPKADAFTYQCRGECYQALGEREKAHADFVTARRLEQNA